MEEEKPEPKISDVEAILVSILLLGCDALDVIFTIFGMGIDLPITDIIAFPLEQIYLIMKGVGASYALIGNILELLPYADFLPFRTVAWMITTYADRHPTVGAAIDVASKVKGGGGAGSGPRPPIAA